MITITIDAQVGSDRRLIYTLPSDVPIGPVKLIIQPIEEIIPTSVQSLTREEARRRLLAAGKLGTTPLAPAGAEPLSDSERQRLARLFGNGSLSTLDMINIDRGPKE